MSNSQTPLARAYSPLTQSPKAHCIIHTVLCPLEWHYIIYSQVLPSITYVWEHHFSHTSDIPPCREQLWDKSISHGFHDLQLCTLYLAWLKCKVCEKMHFVWFSMRDGFLTTRLRIPPSSLRDSGGIRRLVVRKIHLTWQTIQNAYHLTSHIILVNSHIHKHVLSLQELKVRLTLRQSCLTHPSRTVRIGQPIRGPGFPVPGESCGWANQSADWFWCACQLSYFFSGTRAGYHVDHNLYK